MSFYFILACHWRFLKKPVVINTSKIFIFVEITEELKTGQVFVMKTFEVAEVENFSWEFCRKCSEYFTLYKSKSICSRALVDK